MPTRSILIVARFFPLLLLLASAGCGHSGEGTGGPAAAIGDGEKGGSSGEGTEASKARNAMQRLHPVVVFDTSLGSFRIRLDAEKAKLTVDNFLTYVDSGYYNQTVFHQVFKGQGVVGGGYTAQLSEKPTRTTIRNEADNGVKNLRGTIAMVRQIDGIDSASSQFFINLADNPALDHKDRTPEGYGYCVFGQVIEGVDVVDKIGSVEVKDSPQFERTPAQTVLINSVRRTR